MNKRLRVSPLVAVLSLWLAAWIAIRLDAMACRAFAITAAIANEHPWGHAVMKGLVVGGLFVIINGAAQRAVRSWRDRRSEPPPGDGATRGEQHR